MTQAATFQILAAVALDGAFIAIARRRREDFFRVGFDLFLAGYIVSWSIDVRDRTAPELTG